MDPISGWRVLCEMFERRLFVSLKKGFITRCRGFSIPLVCISKNAEEAPRRRKRTKELWSDRAWATRRKHSSYWFKRLTQESRETTARNSEHVPL